MMMQGIVRALAVCGTIGLVACVDDYAAPGSKSEDDRVNANRPLEELQTHSLLLRLMGVPMNSGYPTCVYNESTGGSLSGAQERVTNIQQVINMWLDKLYGHDNYPVSAASLSLQAETKADCDALPDSPLPLRLTDNSNDPGACGGLMIENTFRCSVHDVSGITLHEVGHMLGLGHEQSMFDVDGEHPLGLESVMNYEFLTSPSLLPDDEVAVRFLWSKIKWSLDAVCPAEYQRLGGHCAPRSNLVGGEPIRKIKRESSDECVGHAGGTVTLTACDSAPDWSFDYDGLRQVYTIAAGDQCMARSGGGLVVQACNLDDTLHHWGVRDFGAFAQIEGAGDGAPWDSGNCLILDDNPEVGDCGWWDNLANPMYVTAPNSLVEL